MKLFKKLSRAEMKNVLGGGGNVKGGDCSGSCNSDTDCSGLCACHGVTVTQKGSCTSDV